LYTVNAAKTPLRAEPSVVCQATAPVY
jgi:hypothetical protein